MVTAEDRCKQCLSAMRRFKIADQNDGSHRLYAAACRAVEWDLNDAQSVFARHPAKSPALDPKRIINESSSFLKEREPEMTAEEYALYERVVTMLTTRPEFALKLLEALRIVWDVEGVPRHVRDQVTAPERERVATVRSVA